MCKLRAFGKADLNLFKRRWQCIIRELTNRRLLHDGAVGLRDMLTAHAFLSTCQLRAKVDNVGESDLPASWKQEDASFSFQSFLSMLRVFLPDNLGIISGACL